MWKWIKRFPYGEAVLWLLFLAFALASASEYSDGDAATMAGVCALAAVGVRATRRARESDNAA